MSSSTPAPDHDHSLGFHFNGPSSLQTSNSGKSCFFSIASQRELCKWVILVCISHGFLPLGIFSSASPVPAELAQIPVSFLMHAKKPELFDWMVGIRRKIHDPELGFEEFETSKLIMAELDQMGIPYKYPVAITGVVGFLGTGDAPYVALRADTDALEMEERIDWEHKSKVAGKMHACGHDAHVAMLLGAAKILKEHSNELQGTILLFFQPAEEGGAGAKKMLEAGALKNVNAIFGMHVASGYPIGAVASRAGPILAESGMFEAVITGKGGHAGIPQQAVDPILAASSVIVSLQHLVSREADPLDSQVVTVAKIQGGVAFNVIPDSVTIGGTFRAFSKESFLQLQQRIEEVSRTQASVLRCNATVVFNKNDKPSYPVTINNKDLHEHFKNVAEAMLGAENVFERQPLMGAEDFSFFAEVIPGYFFFAEVIPGYFFFVGMKYGSQGQFPPGHSPNFRVNEDVLPYGAALYASLATRYLLEHKSKSAPRGLSFHEEL